MSKDTDDRTVYTEYYGDPVPRNLRVLSADGKVIGVVARVSSMADPARQVLEVRMDQPADVQALFKRGPDVRFAVAGEAGHFEPVPTTPKEQLENRVKAAMHRKLTKTFPSLQSVVEVYTRADGLPQVSACLQLVPGTTSLQKVLEELEDDA